MTSIRSGHMCNTYPNKRKSGSLHRISYTKHPLSPCNKNTSTINLNISQMAHPPKTSKYRWAKSDIDAISLARNDHVFSVHTYKIAMFWVSISKVHAPDASMCWTVIHSGNPIMCASKHFSAQAVWCIDEIFFKLFKKMLLLRLEWLGRIFTL